MKNKTCHKVNNCKINPILYKFYLLLKDKLGVTIVHRRRRKSTNSLEVIITNKLFDSVTGRMNTLKEAEACGYWMVLRRQKGAHATWRGKTVYQLFLTPVHPKKHFTLRQASLIAEQVSFEPVTSRRHRRTTIPSEAILQPTKTSQIASIQPKYQIMV